MKKLKLIGTILESILKVFIVLCGIFLILLYFICNKIGIHFDLFIVLIYPCGLCFMFITYEFIRLFESLKLNKPFCIENVFRFKNSMISCFIITVLLFIAFLLTILLYNYYTTQLKAAIIFIMLLFFACGIALYILSVLFDQANKYKEENDLTI